MKSSFIEYFDLSKMGISLFKTQKILQRNVVYVTICVGTSEFPVTMIHFVGTMKYVSIASICGMQEKFVRSGLN